MRLSVVSAGPPAANDRVLSFIPACVVGLKLSLLVSSSEIPLFLSKLFTLKRFLRHSVLEITDSEFTSCPMFLSCSHVLNFKVSMNTIPAWGLNTK